MPDYIHTVTADFTNHEDAIALRDLIRELGFEAQLTYRAINEGTRSPMRETRLGILVLDMMRPTPGTSPKSFNLEEVGAMLEEHHYAPTSASVVLSALAAEGDVDRVSRGIYRLKA